MNYLRLFVIALYLGILTGCSKEKDEEMPASESISKDVKMLNATSYDKWIYFSFRKGEIVQVSEPENDLNWDIAFQRWYVKTNSGTSGKGQGGAINTKATVWEKITSAPLTDYKPDAIGILSGWDVQKNVETKKEGSFSQEASVYVTYIEGGRYKNKNEIYCLKTADGKYVKIQFYDYVNKKLKGGYPSFRYKISETPNF